MTAIKTIPGILGAGLLLALAQPALAQTVKMTAVAGHPAIFPWVKLADEFFIPEVDKRLAAANSKTKFEWTKAWGGTAVKLGSESGAIKDGLAELAFVSTIFEAPKFPLQNVSYVAPFMTDDVAVMSKVVKSMQAKIPAMGEAWTKNNMIFLGGTGLDSYHLFTKGPINKLEDLNGKKINAPGPSANWVKGTGAVAVAGTLQTYYNDIQTGVTEGALTFTTGAFPAKLIEVAPHITKVNYGAQFAGALVMSKRVYDKLPADARKIVNEVGAEYDAKFAALLTATTVTLMQKMVEGGAKVRDLSPAERKQWAMALPNVALPWAKDLDAKGLPGTVVLNEFVAQMKAANVSFPRDWSKE
ncbi:MAG: C4-dicarboxylate TRAP transporter substrate-binding protein [Ferrovibrio sp.]|uniref:C4-dicarboxylate TRAP transporter substrate-binding protein n=1 Tax=Ferrovibrio sp. TaxID=1917215 RepID=UPI002610EC79|nr:C4-dicarboxylate TRAP transporter substrate-binding protein [Ferrovibrio sp.]MCW0236584.1 C4-dicarboxylate TRAP transporter substrate-binding protein [Ferrovibrio sp.]